MRMSNITHVFAVRSDPRSYLAHDSGAPASTRVSASTHTHSCACINANLLQCSQSHADLTKHASPACASFFPPRQAYERQPYGHRVKSRCASPGYKYDAHIETLSNRASSRAFAFPSVLRFAASVLLRILSCIMHMYACMHVYVYLCCE